MGPSSKMVVFYPLGVDYNCVSDVQFGCAFHHRMRFQCNFWVLNTENDIENACDGETHTQTAHPKRKCNRPLMIVSLRNALLYLHSSTYLPVYGNSRYGESRDECHAYRKHPRELAEHLWIIWHCCFFCSEIDNGHINKGLMCAKLTCSCGPGHRLNRIWTMVNGETCIYSILLIFFEWLYETDVELLKYIQTLKWLKL
jgi:hypothetical protein